MENEKELKDKRKEFFKELGALILGVFTTVETEEGFEELARAGVALMLREAVEELKRHLENPEDNQINWSSPWVTYDRPAYPDLSWRVEATGESPVDFVLNVDNLPADAEAALERGDNPFKLLSVKKWLLEKGVQFAIVETLIRLTGRVIYNYKNGKKKLMVLSPELEAELSQAQGEGKVDLLNKIDREAGFYMGAVPRTLPGGQDRACIETWFDGGPEDRPGFVPGIVFNVGGGEVEFVLYISPLTVNEDGTAFFRVSVGLVAVPKNQGAKAVYTFWEDSRAFSSLSLDPDGERVELSLETLTLEERAELWELLLKEPKLAAPPPGGTFGETLNEEVRLLYDSSTRVDKTAFNAVTDVFLGEKALALPRSISKIPKWEDLEKAEVDRLIKEDRADLLEKRTVKNPETGSWDEAFVLSSRARGELRKNKGVKGFREIIKDADKVRREYLIKHIPVQGGGYVEGRLTWYQSTWLLSGKDVEERERELKEAQKQPFLFDDLDYQGQKEINRRLAFLSNIREARVLMPTLLKKFGQLGENPLKVPAWELRKVLNALGDSSSGHERVKGCLRALQELKFELKIAGVSSSQGGGERAFGSFLETVYYIPGGPGRHGDGDWIIRLSEAAVGCLKVFSQGAPVIKDLRKTLQVYDWRKKLSKEEKEELKLGEYMKCFSALGTYFDQAKGFTKYQRRLREWIERQITLKKDTTKRGAPYKKVKVTAPDSEEPRLYDSRFCPFLKDGLFYHGALGHFRRNPETGRRLFGTLQKSTRSGGLRPPGLLSEMGYYLPSGGADRTRAEMTRFALEDMKAVVEEALGGIVAGKFKGEWIRLGHVKKLRTEEVLKEVTWFFFLPEDWRERLHNVIEEHSKREFLNGQSPFMVRITNNLTDKLAAEASRGFTIDRKDNSEKDGVNRLPLQNRLRIARVERELKLEDVGRLFGVSKMTVSNWERGPELDPETGKRKGKPIPSNIAPLLVRWIETGTAPTPEELSHRKKIKTG